MNDWIEYHYHHTKHSSINCSPFEKFTQQQQQISRLNDERTLDILLAPIPNNKGMRTVTKDKGIEIETNSFIHAELSLYIGEKVFCRYNPKDVGKIYVFNRLTSEFICEAVCPEIAGNGITRQEIAIAAKQKQRKALSSDRKEISKAARQYNVREIAHEIIARKKQKNGSVAAFPKPSEEIENASTKAAKKATEDPKNNEYSEEEKQKFEIRRKALIASEKNHHTREFQSPFSKAQYLTKSSLERELTPTEKSWLHDYRRKNRAALPVLNRILNTKKISGDNK